MSTIAQEYTIWPANGTDPEEERFVDPTRPWEAIPGPELAHPPPDDGRVRHQRMCNCNFVRPGEERPHQASTSNGKPHGASTSNPNPTHTTKPSKLSLLYWKNRWSKKANRNRQSIVIPDEESGSTHMNGSAEGDAGKPCLSRGRLQATPAAFQAYGHWARPVFKYHQDPEAEEDAGIGDPRRYWGVIVDNAYRDPEAEAGPSRIGTEELQEMVASLREPDGTTYPERWRSRAEHPSLPPRPSLWPTPPPSPHPPPLPTCQIQLNPFLEHRVIGKSPIKFDLRAQYQDNVELGDKPPKSIPWDKTRTPQLIFFNPRGPNGAQPATYPGVTEMRIVAVAEEPLGRFPWPFTVHARDGLPVTVQDVVFSMLINFGQFMTREELEAFEFRRREIIEVAYRQRLKQKRFLEEPGDVVDAVEEVIEGVRRVDLLGSSFYFRGLEPSPDGDGWIMFVGPLC